MKEMGYSSNNKKSNPGRLCFYHWAVRNIRIGDIRLNHTRLYEKILATNKVAAHQEEQQTVRLTRVSPNVGLRKDFTDFTDYSGNIATREKDIRDATTSSNTRDEHREKRELISKLTSYRHRGELPTNLEEMSVDSLVWLLDSLEEEGSILGDFGQPDTFDTGLYQDYSRQQLMDKYPKDKGIYESTFQLKYAESMASEISFDDSDFDIDTGLQMIRVADKPVYSNSDLKRLSLSGFLQEHEVCSSMVFTRGTNQGPVGICYFAAILNFIYHGELLLKKFLHPAGIANIVRMIDIATRGSTVSESTLSIHDTRATRDSADGRVQFFNDRCLLLSDVSVHQGRRLEQDMTDLRKELKGLTDTNLEQRALREGVTASQLSKSHRHPTSDRKKLVIELIVAQQDIPEYLKYYANFMKKFLENDNYDDFMRKSERYFSYKHSNWLEDGREGTALQVRRPSSKIWYKSAQAILDEAPPRDVATITMPIGGDNEFERIIQLAIFNETNYIQLFMTTTRVMGRSHYAMPRTRGEASSETRKEYNTPFHSNSFTGYTSVLDESVEVAPGAVGPASDLTLSSLHSVVYDTMIDYYTSDCNFHGKTLAKDLPRDLPNKPGVLFLALVSEVNVDISPGYFKAPEGYLQGDMPVYDVLDRLQVLHTGTLPHTYYMLGGQIGITFGTAYRTDTGEHGVVASIGHAISLNICSDSISGSANNTRFMIRDSMEGGYTFNMKEGETIDSLVTFLNTHYAAPVIGITGIQLVYGAK
jgi:hypothetical protein